MMSTIRHKPPKGGKCRLDRLIWYSRLTGIMLWKEAPNSRGAAKVGGFAGVWTKGGIYIGLDGRTYAAHHLAWLMHYGEWPPCEIDHKNGDACDNRIWNLRLASRVEQGRNQRCKPGTSKYKGVSRHSQFPTWVARIRTDEGRKSLGCFRDEADAARAYDAAARIYHGEFACVNFPKEHERPAI